MATEPIDVIDYARITRLDLSDMGLTELPDLSMYTNLEKLLCNDNLLTKIENLPHTLKELYCSNNRLTHVDNLSSGLEILICCQNQITSFFCSKVDHELLHPPIHLMIFLRIICIKIKILFNFFNFLYFLFYSLSFLYFLCLFFFPF
jgi:hypothetical protein